MIKPGTFFMLAFYFISLSACGQTPKPVENGAYIIDNSIKSQVDKKVKSFKGLTMSSMDFRMYQNGNLIGDTYAKGKSIDECMTMTTLQGDTINIVGFMGMFAGFGYQISLFKDTCIVRHFAKSDTEIYKLHENDSLEFGVSVPCKTYKLTLAEKPTFKKGQILEGIIELTSDEYYEVANDKESKFKIQLTGYFRTDPLGSTGDKYNKTKNE
ncbi:hypothetical protein HB364_00590 [Pseudoflavitalea sp. X16]|uniref:hypothetical protein n=1 Tax=Paraflavitalea devenefica TaxID=2716334 RepID=UPI0014224E37|nr:hypothetical protein [Paraflavitalea devenefica]NII23556.1 hypothetical protein [Paraflavitalea devenefica]